VAAPAPVASRRRNRERLGWSAALLAGIAAAWLAGQRQRPADSSPAIRLSVPAPPQTTIGLGLALSSDGRSLAFVGTREGKQLLWLRLLGGVEARPLSGTDGAFNPFWSPDARFIGFFADNKLKTIEVASGSVRTLCSLQTIEPLSGGTWSPSGFILFGPDSHSPLFRVSAGGGVPAPATELDRSRKESAHIWPEFLPDGRHFLYWSLAGEEQGVAVAEVGSRAKKLLIPGAPKAVYAPPGFVLFSRGGTLYSQPFDATHLQLSGEPIPTAEGVDYDFSAARDGIVAYRAGAIDVRQFRWFDRAGKELAKVGRPGDYLDPTLSPDGTRLAVGIGEWTPVGDIWLLDVARGSFSRLTSHPFDDITPVWSPDGKQIAFASNRNGAFDLFRKDVGGAGNEELLLHSNVDKFPMDWSRDGRSLVFITIDPKTRADMWILPMTGERKPSLFLQTEYNESNAALSPDGHWIAYNSDESGMPEVYVRPFPSGADRWQVSTQGGVQPAWRADGRELYYASPDTKIMAVEIKPASGFAAGLPVALFQAPIRAEGITESHTAFAASPDGQRFLVNTINEDAARVPITVVVHWASELKP
jgi:Tol biopolymer transport system component